MRIFALLSMTATLAAGCGPADHTAPRVYSQSEFEKVYFWAIPQGDLSERPSLVISRAGPVFPRGPLPEVSLTCLENGGVEVAGDRYQMTSDLGLIPTKAQFGLRANEVALFAEPIWENNDWERSAHFVLRPRPHELSALLTGRWFEVASPFEDGSGSERFPPPPPALAAAFLKGCSALRGVG